MIEQVFLAGLSLVTLVASNAVPQGHPNLQYTSLQTPILVSTSPYQTYANQNNHHDQQVTVPNTRAIPVQIDETVLNDLFVNKILKNPSFQKILDSNVIHYNQNCHQNQRQVNSGATPSVINNYFIIPTEFFTLNDKITQEKTDNETIKRKKNNRKPVVSKNEATDKNSTDTLKSKEQNKIRKNRNKKGKKKSTKHVSENVQGYGEKETNSTELVVKTSKKKNKQNYFPDLELTEDVKSPNDTINYNSNKEMNAEATEANINKQRKKKRKSSKSNNKTASKTEEKEHINVLETKDGSHLKDIESPVDNSDITHLQENSRPTKNIKETKNSKILSTNLFNMETNKRVQAINPFNEDIFKHFYSNMYLGNNLFSNGYPFNFGQFYQPLLDAGNIKTDNKNSNKTKNSPNVNEFPPQPIEVKLKPKKKQASTTERSLIETDVDQVKVIVLNTTTTETSGNATVTKIDEKFNSINTTSSLADLTSDVDFVVSKEIDVQQQSVEVEIKQPPELQNEDIDLTKANLEMPPTLIEDLHEYMTPELGREDIVPTIHTNGIIDDYYPIFYENSANLNDESFYLKDLDDRHIYTTDRSFESPLNRDRRKYDRYENYPRPNLDIKDRINFRRTNKFHEEKKSTLNDYDKTNTRRIYLGKNIENQNLATETSTDAKDKAEIGDQFQIPPLLENPDFKTTRIEKLSLNSDLDSQQIIYSDNMKKLSDIKTDVDEAPHKFSRLINFEPDLIKNNEIPTTEKPKRDKIETVYAKSKVATYGVGKNEDKTSSLPLDHGNREFNDDDRTTYVVAKSLGHVDDYY